MLFDPQNPWKIFNEALKSGLFNAVLPKSATPDEIREKLEYSLKNPSSISCYDFNSNIGVSKINGIETKLLLLLYRKFSEQEIAQKMNLSFKTIEGIKLGIMEKLGLKNVNDLITYAENNCL
jgi:DNA-binding NarL/FixJ family response regulator